MEKQTYCGANITKHNVKLYQHFVGLNSWKDIFSFRARLLLLKAMVPNSTWAQSLPLTIPPEIQYFLLATLAYCFANYQQHSCYLNCVPICSTLDYFSSCLRHSQHFAVCLPAKSLCLPGSLLMAHLALQLPCQQRSTFCCLSTGGPVPATGNSVGLLPAVYWQHSWPLAS